MSNGNNRSGGPPVDQPLLGDTIDKTEEYEIPAEPEQPAEPPPRVNAPAPPAMSPRAPVIAPPGAPRAAPVIAPPGAPRVTAPGARTGQPATPIIAPPGAPRAPAQPTGPVIVPPGAPRAQVPVVAPVVPPFNAPAPAAGAPLIAPRVAPIAIPPVTSRPSAVMPPAGAPPVQSRAPSVLVPPAAPLVAPVVAPVASRPSTVMVPPPPLAPPVARPVASSPSMAVPMPGALPARKPGPLPESGSIEAVTPQQAGQLAALAGGLDSQDYFQVLQVPQTAGAGDIKRAFYRESRVYHPDRFFHLTDEQTKENIGAIYRRITEAYYVLRDDAKRKKYLADLSGPERATKLRFNEASEAEQKAEAKKVAQEEFGNNPKSRPFFKSALSDIANQNWAAAERNLKMGLTYEPGNAKFKEKLVEVQRKVEEVRKASGDSFKIK